MIVENTVCETWTLVTQPCKAVCAVTTGHFQTNNVAKRTTNQLQKDPQVLYEDRIIDIPNIFFQNHSLVLHNRGLVFFVGWNANRGRSRSRSRECWNATEILLSKWDTLLNKEDILRDFQTVFPRKLIRDLSPAPDFF